MQTTRRSSSVDRSGQRKHKPDYGLLVITIILLAIGLIVVYSIGPGLASLKNVDESYFIYTVMAFGAPSYTSGAQK